MSDVHARGVSVAYGKLTALKQLDLRVEHGQFVVLLGPSGCGKSTLLNSIAGLTGISAGQIWIKDKNVTWAEPRDRGIAMVFQSYALYPKMSVAENLSFALRVARLPRSEIDARVKKAAETLQITNLLHRRPSELSGGQRQRVAIGRALVRESDVFLFDEPLSNLDAQLRVELRMEIKRLHRRLGSTAIYVTHDQVEALTLADLIAVMNQGQVKQLGTPADVYERPSSRFVAGFVGSPSMNFVEGQLEMIRAHPVFHWNGKMVPLNRYAFSSPSSAIPGPATLGIRPEHVVIGEAARVQDFVNEYVVDMVEPMGADTLAWCSDGSGHLISVRTPTEMRLAEGDRLPLGISASRASLFAADTGKRL